MYEHITKIIKSLDGYALKNFIESRKLHLMPEEENKSYIGANKFRNVYISKTKSSTNEFLVDQKISIEAGTLDYRYAVIGNIDDAYLSLIAKINNEEGLDFEKICTLVYDTVTEYFGYGADSIKRLEVFKTIDEVDHTPLSDIKGMDAAMCVERAMLSHNLLKFIGINSTLKISEIMNDEKLDTHAYNLIPNKGKYFIFDSSLPKIIDSKVTPLVTEMTSDAYELIKSPERDIGASIEVVYNTPRRTNTYNIVYDNDRDYSEFYDYSARIK